MKRIGAYRRVRDIMLRLTQCPPCPKSNGPKPTSKLSSYTSRTEAVEWRHNSNEYFLETMEITRTILHLLLGCPESRFLLFLFLSFWQTEILLRFMKLINLYDPATFLLQSQNYPNGMPIQIDSRLTSNGKNRVPFVIFALHRT